MLPLFLIPSMVLAGCLGRSGEPADSSSVLRNDTALETSEAGAITIYLPFDAAPDQGLAVRLFFPSAQSCRFQEGAPVVLLVPGGFDAGDLALEEPDPMASRYGYIMLRYLLPGGESDDGSFSGGDFDFRGLDSIEATAQVMRYAGGQMADSQGLTILDRLPFALPGELGILGQSNGGNLALQAIVHALDLPPLAWFAAWESPVGDQYVTEELNGNLLYDPGTCQVTTCPMDGLEQALHFDPHAVTAETDWDYSIQELEGALFLDFNGNGSYDPDDGEITVSGIPGPRNQDGQAVFYPSQELADIILQDTDAVFGSAIYPEWLAVPEDIPGFWNLRDGSLVLEQAQHLQPDMLLMQLGSQDDHIQTQPDYPHARSHLRGWLDLGHGFVRMNPDSQYMALVTGQEATSFPDNDAGQEPPWPGTDSWMEPELVGSIAVDSHLIPAAILELADRAHLGDLSENLQEVAVLR